jgi:flagella basal body P-ring formation protein FlgA
MEPIPCGHRPGGRHRPAGRHHLLLAGSVLRAEDVHIARVHTTLVRSGGDASASDAIGMQLGARQPPASRLPSRADAPVDGAEGGNVMIDSPGITLTAQGQALEAGAIGERIRVLNPVSRAVLEAEVVGPDRVRVAPNAMPLTRPMSPGSNPGFAQVSVR